MRARPLMVVTWPEARSLPDLDSAKQVTCWHRPCQNYDRAAVLNPTMGALAITFGLACHLG